MTDTPDGFDRAPTRYMRHDRETVDRMRDLAHDIFGDPALSDLAFAYACATHALKYRDRAGLKGAADVDERKAAWWTAMQQHVLGDGPDPRAERVAFSAWKRAASSTDVHHLATIARRQGVADGHFIVGRMDGDYEDWTWSRMTIRERDQVEAIIVGDIVDALLPDGRIVREAVTRVDLDETRACFSFELRGGCSVYVSKIRLPGGWRRKRGVTYHDHLGMDGQRVPYTCPALSALSRIIARVSDPLLRQSLQGHLELQRAYHAQLRRNQRGGPL